MKLSTRLWLHRLDTRQAMAVMCHPRLELPAELLAGTSIATSTRRILTIADTHPQLLAGYDPRHDAQHLLGRLEQHLARCEQLLDDAELATITTRAALRQAVFTQHRQVSAELADSALALAEAADHLEARAATRATRPAPAYAQAVA